MCTVLLPPGVNPIAVNKYINIKCIPFVGKVPPGSMVSLDFPRFTESLPTLQQAYIKADH